VNLIKVLKVISDENRLRILNLLIKQDLCVCEMEVLLNISQSNVSRHLSILSNAGILEYYKVAKYVYYTITDNITKEFPFMSEILEEHTNKLNRCNVDYQRLCQYKESGLTCDDLTEGRVSF